MRYEDPRKSRPEPARQGCQASTPPVAPGKRTLAMQPPLRRGGGPVPVQRKADPASEAARRERARSIDTMLAMAVRPDLDPGAGHVAGSAAHGSHEGLAPEQSDERKRNYLAASTPAVNDLAPTGSSGLTEIRLRGVDIQGELYEEAGNWKVRVAAAVTRIHWGISNSGYRTPRPVDGGNITADNWQEVARELEGYEARQATGAWHHPEASIAHELDHVSWYQDEIASTWAAIEQQIQSHVLGSTSGMNRRIAEQAMRAYLDTKRHDWFNAYGVAPEPRAYRVGQQVLNHIVEQIRAYARSKGWGTPGAAAPGAGGGP